MDNYPPLKSLIVLDAAMRHRSFSLAAEELCVTAGAVGQQIQKLESWLGAPLFLRQIRQLQPTPEGLAYWQRLQPALAQILAVSRQFKNRHSRCVWLSMPPSFAAKWFPRRMADFLTRHPEVELHLNASTALADFERDGIDLAIRYFTDNDPSLDATLLYRDQARAYCHPDYAARHQLCQPDDLARITLLETTLQPHWRPWLRQFTSHPQATLDAIPRIHFDQSMIAIEAAKQGQGLVMTSPILVEEETAAGQLIELFPAHFLHLPSGYYVVHPRRLPLRPAAAALKSWLAGKLGEGMTLGVTSGAAQ